MCGNNNTMPLWGPYSKKYMGLSRIIDSNKKSGARFDFTVHPTVWNSSFPVPNVTIPSSYHLWHCKSDYSFYSYRFELIWKDQLYADVSFSKLDDEAYLMRCEFVNNTELKQNCVLNFFSSLEFPNPQYCKVVLPERAVLINANDYIAYEYKKPRPWDFQNSDGMHKGEFPDCRFYGGFGLGDRNDSKHVPTLNLKPFGAEAGDFVSYAPVCESFENPVICIRYRTTSDASAEFLLCRRRITLPASDELTFAFFEMSAENGITLESLGAGGVELDFLAVLEAEDRNDISASLENQPFTPVVTTEQLETGKRLLLEYREMGEQFYILTHNEKVRERILETGCLEDALPNRLSNGDHTYDDLTASFSNSFSRKKSDEGFFHNTLIHSVYIEPHSAHTEYAVISKSRRDALSCDEYERLYRISKGDAEAVSYNESGEKYKLSTEILKSTLFTNVVYPVYKHGENIVHFTPGKRWDSFYTWDSGLIGLGVLEYSREKAEYILETYLSAEGNSDFAFLLHGSLVPTQFAQYLEMLKRENDKSRLLSLYDKMLRYYDFLAGRNGSTTAKFGNGLLTTYDYWYSCSGMDDYPAQVYMISKNMMHKICPCISTSHIIRAAKIMRMAALYLGREEDAARLLEDAQRGSAALNNLCWDEDSGYYSYTVYDENKNITGFLRNESGENMNKGMDGIYPLVAGAVSGERAARLLSHIKNPDEMWSKSGISAVDMSASYFLSHGYWNGNVWMAHQWFIWKTMLDMGEADFAFEIAQRALDMWKAETDYTYNTYECFGIETQRGGWFHNFGGLSAPICIWANAYYKAGTITTGFDVWIDSQSSDGLSACLKYKYFGSSEKFTVIVCLEEGRDYKAMLNGSPVEINKRQSGICEITLSNSQSFGELNIF